MTAFFRTAIYMNNVPPFERVLRVLFAAAGVAASFVYFSDPLLQWTGVGSALGFALTGVLGFCPACYLAGRKLASRSRP